MKRGKAMLFDYDDRSIDSIFEYAKRLEGMTFNEISDEYNHSLKKFYTNPMEPQSFKVKEDTVEYKTPGENAKGQLGNFLERYYFGYMPNGVQDADFSKTGVELKQTCIDQKKNGDYSAGERLSITNISYKEPVEDDFYKSHVWAKIKLILLVHYLRDKSKNRMDYEIKYVNLFTPPQDDLSIIIQDYLNIIEKIKNGKAHEISESDTLYLGASTKGANAEKSTVPQYYGDHTPARKRNFCFKRQYMDYILHEYVLKDRVPCESIIKNNGLTAVDSFEAQILNMINRNAGKTDEQLCHMYTRPYNNNKAQWIDLSYRMLGIKSSQADEFVKANIVVKAIRIEKNGKIRESMSLPVIDFKKLAAEDFEYSDFCEYFEETRFLFVVYKSDGAHYVLKGAQLWNMPLSDLYGDAKNGWEAIQKKIKEGINFTVKGDVVSNDLPSKKDNRIIHIRPHAPKAACKLNNGFEKGNLQRDANQLPNGEWMTKQSFWLNNTYVLSQLKIEDI